MRLNKIVMLHKEMAGHRKDVASFGKMLRLI